MKNSQQTVSLSLQAGIRVMAPVTEVAELAVCPGKNGEKKQPSAMAGPFSCASIRRLSPWDRFLQSGGAGSGDGESPGARCCLRGGLSARRALGAPPHRPLPTARLCQQPQVCSPRYHQPPSPNPTCMKTLHVSSCYSARRTVLIVVLSFWCSGEAWGCHEAVPAICVSVRARDTCADECACSHLIA